MIVTPTNQPQEKTQKQVGGKAAALFDLYDKGVRIPPTIAIPVSASKKSAYRALSQNEVCPVLSDICKEIMEDPTIKDHASFAVRSSGVNEDGEKQSFAGMYTSVLNVPTNAIQDAIKEVWESAENEDVKMYKKDSGSDAMGVIIQPMIESEYSGVAFSVSPSESDERISTIEVVKGQCEKLVSGKATPSTIRLNKLTNQIRVIRSAKDIDDQTSIKISEIVAKELVSLERLYGFAVDIEWTVIKEQLYILQLRPITA